MKCLERKNHHDLQEMLDKFNMYKSKLLEDQEERIKHEIALELKHRNCSDDFIADVLDYEIEKIEVLEVSKLLQMLYEELGDATKR